MTEILDFFARTNPIVGALIATTFTWLVTAAGAFFLFGEKFTAPELAGAALTLFATWRVAAGPKRRTAVVSPPLNPANSVQFPDLPKP